MKNDIKNNVNLLTQYKNLVDSIRIDHVAYKTTYERLIESYESVGHSATPVCLHIVGESRTGKSCVLKDFIQSYLPDRNPDGRQQSVVYAPAPAKATVSAILEQLLKALGDPYWARGAQSNKTQRLQMMLDAVGCKMIIIDEFQHLVDKGQRAQLALSVDWLKGLIEHKQWALVAAGLPESCSVIQTNVQLANRFDATLIMPLFDWHNKKMRLQFKGVLQEFSHQLHPFELPDMSSDEIGLRFFLATSGRVGLLAKLIDRAVSRAIAQNTPKIRIEDLSNAYMDAIWSASQFPLEGGPFFASLEACSRRDVAQRVMGYATQERHEDTSAKVVIGSTSTASLKAPSSMNKRQLRDAMGGAL